MSAFPSREHLAALRRKLRGKYFEMDHFSAKERNEFHAYDYAFRRIYLDDRTEVLSLDPERERFDRALVADAVEFYRSRGGGGAA
jgi:hypothetical protein